MPFMEMDHAVDPREHIRNSVGDISGIEVFHNQILVGIYVRPGKTKSGLYIPDKTKDEDKYQGKVGVILKMGSTAGKDSGDGWFSDVTLNVGDWVLFRPSDGWPINVHNFDCRVLEDIHIKGRITSPDEIF